MCPYEKESGNLFNDPRIVTVNRMFKVFGLMAFLMAFFKRRTRHSNASHYLGSKEVLISNILQWSSTQGRSNSGRPARINLQQFCTYTGWRVEKTWLKRWKIGINRKVASLGNSGLHYDLYKMIKIKLNTYSKYLGLFKKYLNSPNVNGNHFLTQCSFPVALTRIWVLVGGITISESIGWWWR